MAVTIPAVVVAVPVAAVTVTASRRAATKVLASRFPLHDLDRDQRQLAAVVHLADLHLDLVADLDHVVDVLDPGAAVQLADLGDVQQAVLAGQQRDERAERGRLHHGAQEALADLGDVRVGDRIDGRPRGLGRRALGGADVDRAVVLDGDLGAGVLLDGVDHLALGADHLADLVHRHLDRDDPRRERAHLRGCVDGLAHHVEDRQPGRPRESGPWRCRPPSRAAGHRRQAATSWTRRPTPWTWIRWTRSPRRPAGSRRGTLPWWEAPGSGRARPARRGRSRAAWASPPGRSHRWSTAACCSCACTAWCAPG